MSLYSAGAYIFLFMMQFGKACIKKDGISHSLFLATIILAFHLKRATDFSWTPYISEYGKLRSSKKSDSLPKMTGNPPDFSI